MNRVVGYDGGDNNGISIAEVPGSKSWAARYLLLAYLGGNSLSFNNMPTCADIQNLISALNSLGEGGVVNVGESGTALRFLTALAAVTPGCDAAITGSERLMSRPIKPLTDVLCLLGADIRLNGKEIVVKGKSLKGGSVEIDGSISSQFISALMLAATAMNEGLKIKVCGTPVSRPYIEMTAMAMRQAGIEVSMEGDVISVAPGTPELQKDMVIPADWSAASYIYEAVALRPTTAPVKILGLRFGTLQADEACALLFEPLGITTTVEPDGIMIRRVGEADCSESVSIDMRSTPDIMPTMAVTYAMKGIPFHIGGLATLRTKESDRISAIATGLRQLGFDVKEGEASIEWDGALCDRKAIPSIDSCGDHRIAMAFAPAAVAFPIEIKGAQCVEKSFPNYFTQLENLGWKEH